MILPLEILFANLKNISDVVAVGKGEAEWGTSSEWSLAPASHISDS